MTVLNSVVMNILNCRLIRAIKSPRFISLLEKTKRCADDYASAAERNLHEPTSGFGDGRTDRQTDGKRDLT